MSDAPPGGKPAHVLIALDCGPYLASRTGVGVTTGGLARALLAHGGDVRLRLCAASIARGAARRLSEAFPADAADVVVRPLPLRWLTPLCDRGWPSCERLWGRADIHHVGPLLVPRAERAPLVVSVYDLTPIHFPALHLASNRFDRATLRRRLGRAARVIVPSRATADDLEAELGVTTDVVRIVPLAADPRFRPLGDPERAAARRTLLALGLEGEFLLAVGAVEPRKNLPRLLEAFRILRERDRIPHRLAVVGPAGWLTGPFDDALRAPGLREAVVATGYVGRDVLNALYGNAALLVYPSLYEGFGLPPLEAMAVGCPVVTSRVSSLPEVVGDAGVYFDPAEPEAIAAAVRRVLHSPGLAAQLSAAGRARSRAFSWERTARETTAVYRELLEGTL